MTRSAPLHWRLILGLAVVALLVALRAPGRPFAHGFLAGFLAALVAIELQALFLPIYFANNPGYAEIEIPFGLSARVATAVLGPLNALIAGTITAIITWLFSKPIQQWTSVSRHADAPPED